MGFKFPVKGEARQKRQVLSFRKTMISKKEVEHIAKLSRMGLKPAEFKKFQEELSSILDYIEKLAELDISQVKPTSHSIEIENVVGKDEIKTQSPQVVNSLIEAAPEKEKGFFKVKAVF